MGALDKNHIAERPTLFRRPMRLLAVLFAFFTLILPSLPFGGDVSQEASAGSLPSWTRVFHLHDGVVLDAGEYDWMNSTGPYDPPSSDYDSDGISGVTIKKNVPPQRKHSWVLDPAVNADIVLPGGADVYIWARSRGNESGTIINVRLYDIGPGEIGDFALWGLIAEATRGLNYPFFSEFQLYDVSLAFAPYTLAAGHSIALTVQREDNINDWLIVIFDQTEYDSYIVLPTDDFISVSSVWTEDSGGTQRSVFSDGEPITVVANVTNPFGSYDTIGANVNVTYAGNGTTFLSWTPMSLSSTDPSIPSYWKRFDYTIPQLNNGSYVVNVTARDAQGSPCWLTMALTIVTVDHFDVSAPSTISAGSSFSMTITALDASNATITNWVGNVQIDAFLTDMITNGSGILSNSSVMFTLGDSGQVTIPDQNYSAGEETILLRASSGTHLGWSDAITVRSGPVVRIEINPPGPWLEVSSGVQRPFNATGYDWLDNKNTTWTPNWTVSGGVGDIIGSGLSISFSPTTSGSGALTCRNDPTGASSMVNINVSAGALNSIVILGPNPLEIREAESQALTAVGYDINLNIVNISGATWDTTTSGVVAGSGTSALFTAGYIPESGKIYVRDPTSGVTGSINVTVLTGLDGPWLTEIPVQIRNEDSGSWELSLTGYWHDPDGTDTLVWWVEGVAASLYIVSHDPLSNAIMRFYTQPDQNGEDTFTLWVVDPEGYRAFQDVTVRIVAVNDKPGFSGSTPTKLYVRYDTPYTFDYTYYVFDVDNLKSELSLASSSSSIFFEELVATFIFPQRPGEESYFEFVTMTVRDPTDSSDLQIIVMVTEDNPPSLNSSLPDVTVDEGTVNYPAFDLDDYFYDLDSEYLVYTHGFEHITVSINDTTNIVYISALEEWSGSTEGTFTATDPIGALKVDSIIVTVTAVNDAPEVQSPGTIHVHYDEVYQLPLSAYVNDPDHSLDSLSYSFDNGNVTHVVTFTGSHVLELLFPLKAPLPYTASVMMTVTDPLGASGTCTFNVLVTDNYPPYVTVPNPDQLYYTFREDEYLNNSLRLCYLFSDIDDLYLTFQIAGAENVRATVFSNGVVNLTSALNWFGTEVLTIKAIDPQGAWAFVQAYITVTEVNDAPVIAQVPDIVNTGYPRTAYYPIYMYVYDCDDPYASLLVTATSNAGSVYVVGNYLYVSLPSNKDVISVTLQASDGEYLSNSVTFDVGVAKTMGEKIGWPYTFPLVLLAAGVGGYFFASRLPRPSALENLFLIHNDGRLIAHVTKEENTTLDKDIVSAMFTAVQEFVRDSFQKGEVGLKKLEIGDKNVMIEKGQSAYLALIYSGDPTKETFDMLSMLLRDIEERYKGRIERWNGTSKSVKGVDKMLQDYMSAGFKPGVWHEEELAEKEWVDILDKEA